MRNNQDKDRNPKLEAGDVLMILFVTMSRRDIDPLQGMINKFKSKGSMMQTWRSIPARLFRLIVRISLLLAFMEIADHLMRANLNRVWRYTPLLVNLGGAVVYLLLMYLARLVLRRLSKRA